jgi:hypothetical protein
LAARPFGQERHVLLDELLEAVVLGDGGLELGHLLGRHIAGDIPAVFVALVIVVRAGGALPDDADGAALQTLDLNQLLEEGFGGGLRSHGR